MARRAFVGYADAQMPSSGSSGDDSSPSSVSYQHSDEVENNGSEIDFSWDDKVLHEELVQRVIFVQCYDGNFRDAVVLSYVADEDQYKLAFPDECLIVDMPLPDHAWFLYPKEKLSQQHDRVPRGTHVTFERVSEGSWWGVVCGSSEDGRELKVARLDDNKIYLVRLAENVIRQRLNEAFW